MDPYRSRSTSLTVGIQSHAVCEVLRFCDQIIVISEITDPRLYQKNIFFHYMMIKDQNSNNTKILRCKTAINKYAKKEGKTQMFGGL